VISNVIGRVEGGREILDAGERSSRNNRLTDVRRDKSQPKLWEKETDKKEKGFVLYRNQGGKPGVAKNGTKEAGNEPVS